MYYRYGTLYSRNLLSIFFNCQIIFLSLILEGRRADRGCCAIFWPSSGTVYDIFWVGSFYRLRSNVEELHWLTCFGWCRWPSEMSSECLWKRDWFLHSSHFFWQFKIKKSINNLYRRVDLNKDFFKPSSLFPLSTCKFMNNYQSNNYLYKFI